VSFGGFNFEVQLTSTGRWYREAITSQSSGLLQPWVNESNYYQSGTGCASGRNRFAVDIELDFTQGSRSGNPGLWDAIASR
jgi:hypothetical protein